MYEPIKIELFMLYIQHIIECEGTDFLDQEYPICGKSVLSNDEKNKIRQLYKDFKNAGTK